MEIRIEIMKHFYAINIQNEYATVLVVKKTGNSFDVAEHKVLEPSELSLFLERKKSFYITLEQNEIIDERVSIEQLIKSDSVIRHLIIKKLHDANIKGKILFNYHPLPKNENDEKITYQIDGVFEEEYIQSLSPVLAQEEIKSATINKFSLFGISCECIKERSYFSIHTQANRITTIAVHENELFFSRVNTVVADNAEIRKLNLVQEITQTISYVQQNFREIKFSVIVLSGALAIDDTITDHIHMSSNLPIAVLYPNSFIRGFEAEEAQHYIYSLGSFFVPKKLQFFPQQILAKKQYLLSSNALLLFSAVVLFVSAFFAYEQFSAYSEVLERHDMAKNKLQRVITSTNTSSEEELQKGLAYLQMKQKYMQHHPIDLLLPIKELIKLQKPQDVKWNSLDSIAKMEVTFKRPFETLKELYSFEKDFFAKFNVIDAAFTKEYKNKTDYTKLFFDLTLTLESGKKIEQPAPQMRRRRR